MGVQLNGDLERGTGTSVSYFTTTLTLLTPLLVEH